MASGASGEVVHCPNCKEDVPKTLYCLNCGFPLYKEGQPKEEAKAEPEAKPEPAKPAVPVEEDAVIMVDDEEEEVVKPEETKVEVPAETPAVVPEVKEETPVVEEAPTPKIEPVVEPEIKEPEVKKPEATPEPAPQPEVPEEKASEPAPVVGVVEEKPAEAAPQAPETPPVETPKSAEAPSEPSYTGIEPSKIEAVVLVEEFQAPKTFVPDPLTKDLMENFAKNISLKLKLVKLYRDGALKEETFTRLFEGYLQEGKIWSSRRDEILKKLAGEMEEMEDAYAEATDALELLEVRKTIGEASAGEYTAKAPAYRWDIDNFDNMIGDKRNRTAYLENISNAFTEVELKELKEFASIQYNTLESLQLSKDEFLAAIKDDLYEAIKILG
ncbi:TPA: hypothetical protein HA344_02160 [Candidatus Bathyarchaeota archaeon]|nr:hypothetical protein [Candidatus Bathyarchaeota archaeon]